MYFIIKLIILLEIYIGINKCKAYVLQSTQQHDNTNNNNSNISENSLTEMSTTNPSINIDNIIRPGEIREPSNLQEIVNYVGVDKLSSPASMPQVEESEHILTYTELTKLLAFWQWAKEHNFYEMQTDQPFTKDNFVAVD